MPDEPKEPNESARGEMRLELDAMEDAMQYPAFKIDSSFTARIRDLADRISSEYGVDASPHVPCDGCGVADLLIAIRKLKQLIKDPVEEIKSYVW